MIRQEMFQLIDHLLTQRINMVYLQSLLYLCNLSIQLIIYFSFQSIGLLNIDWLFDSLTVLIVLLVLMGIMLLQVAVYIVRHKDAYLSVQLSIFRFIATPILLLTVLHMSTSSMNSYLGYLFFFLTQMLSDAACRTFLFQIHRVHSVNVTEPSIVGQMSTFQIILISLHFISNPSIMHLLSIILLMIALNTAVTHFYKLESDNTQYKTLGFVNFVHVAMSLVLSYKLIMKVGDSNAYMVILFPIVIYYAAGVLMRKRQCAGDIGKIMAQGADFDDFIQEVDFFLSLLKKDSDSSRNRRQLKNYLVAAVSQHRKDCGMPNCELQTASTFDELKNLKGKHIKLLSFKVLKKIEWLLEQYHINDTEEISIMFTLLKVYAYYLPSRIKMQNLIDQVGGQELTWQHQCELYQYRIICDHIDNAQNIDTIQAGEDFMQFENALITTVHCMAEFWSQFTDEKVDLNRIMLISSKLCPFKAKVQQMAQEQIKFQKFSAYKILSLYSQYLKAILNKYELACKIEEYLVILIQRLRDKQDIKYLSKESEEGFIVISLTESKLGNIFLVNEKACTIFKYTKRQFLSLRVNAIMPGVFADMHDEILTNFLKTKRQNFNTDQRVLFGKDGNGYLFPLMLQLQKASFSANDQYIFIASVRPEKTKKAPIYCIVDHEGIIQEFTASFKNIFFKHRSHKDFCKNIQQIIPDYFDEDYDEQTKDTRYFTSVVRNDKVGEIQVNFVVLPIIIKANHEGFLIRMIYSNSKTVSNYANLNFTATLKTAITSREAYGYENNYIPNSNIFQFLGGQPRLISNLNQDQQISKPAFTERRSVLFVEDKSKILGADIKTIRLIHNHYERIDDEQSFHSEILNSDEKMDIRVKIEQIRSKFAKKEQKAVINGFKIIVLVILAVICCVLFFIYSIYQKQIAEENDFLLIYDYQMQVKYFLPEYIIYFTLNSSGINQSYYSSKMIVLQTELINSVINAEIEQLQKEDVLKITYLRSQMAVQSLLNTSTVQFIETDGSVGTQQLLIWSTVIGLTFTLIVLDILMVYNLKAILFRVYTLFLGVKQSAIRRIQDSCKAFMSKIKLQSKQGQDEQQIKIQNIEQPEDEENNIEKIKQFKNVSRRQDKIYLIELILPLLFLIGFCCLVMIIGNQSFSSYQTIKGYHNIMFESIPAISIEFMKVIVQTFNGLGLTLDNQYAFHYQQLQTVIRQFDDSSQASHYQNIMYGNACQNSQIITIASLSTCQTIANGILTSGIASSLNFIAQSLKNIQATNSYNLTDLEVLIELQFNFVNPVLQDIQDTMEDVLTNIVDPLYTNLSLFTIVIIFAYFLYIFYFILYPMRSMELQLDFTNGMINLIPDYTGQDKSMNDE